MRWLPRQALRVGEAPEQRAHVAAVSRADIPYGLLFPGTFMLFLALY